MTVVYLGDSGIVLGEADAFGVDWLCDSDDPWSPGPAIRAVTGERATDHGSWDASEFYASRTWAFSGIAKCGDHQALHEAKQRFMSTIGIGLDVRFIEPGFDRTARFRRDGAPLWAELTPNTAQFSASLWAADPRAYSTALHTASTPFPSSTGGLTWPATWPATWDATVVDGTMSLPNAGTEIAWPVFRIDGPVTQPVIVNADTGDSMHIDLTLGAGEWVIVDTSSHQVLANGDPNASRRDRFFGTWWGLEPGANTSVFFGAAAGTGAQLSASWHDVWI